MQNQQPIRSHKDLVVWQKGIDLVQAVYRLTAELPQEERFGLSSQLRRAAVSIPSNIAEGRSRTSRKDFIQFLHIALGSASEVETQLEIVRRLRYGRNVDYNETARLLDEVSRMLVAMIASLKARS